MHAWCLCASVYASSCCFMTAVMQANLLASGFSQQYACLCVRAHLLMLLHEVLNVCILAFLGLVDFLLAPQLCIIPQSLHITNIGACLNDTHNMVFSCRAAWLFSACSVAKRQWEMASDRLDNLQIHGHLQACWISREMLNADSCNDLDSKSD